MAETYRVLNKCGRCGEVWANTHDCSIQKDDVIAALREELARVKGELTAREHEVSRMRDMIRETEHERELLERYGRELDEIGRVMGCDHKDDGYMRCIRDHFDTAETKLAAAVAERDGLVANLREAIANAPDPWQAHMNPDLDPTGIANKLVSPGHCVEVQRLLIMAAFDHAAALAEHGGGR